ncbi:MAG: HEAT repeat domain-containing protein [Abditibacteriaceae bacterium]
MQKFNCSHTAKFYVTAVIVMLCSLGLSHQKAFALQRGTSPASLTKSSEIIVRGRITAIEGENLYKQGEAHIQVDSVIKGKWDGKPLYFTLPDAPLPLINWLVVGEYGLFFLKSVDGKNVPVDPFNIMLPIREGMPASEESQDALSSVQDEILFTALGPSVLSKEDQYKQQEFGTSIAKMFPLTTMNLTALGYLAKPAYGDYGIVIPSNEHAANALRTLLSTNKSNTILRGAILSTLLALGQFDVLDEAIKFVGSVPYEKTAGVIGAIGYVNGSQYVPALGNLLKSHHVEMRRSAVTALSTTVFSSITYDKPVKNLKDSVTLPFLMEALDDSDSEVRLRALQALPTAANKPSWFPPLPGKDGIPPQEEQKIDRAVEAMVERRGKQSF